MSAHFGRWLSVAALIAVSTFPLTAAGDTPTAAQSLARLKTGNAEFAARPEDALPISAERRTALTAGQHPFATIVSCADSRVPPEIIFRQGLGDLFVVRVAGHVTDRSVLASVEYAAEHLSVPLVVVMGHEMCGAVKAAIETPAGQAVGPNLGYLLKSLAPAAAQVRSLPEQQRLRAAILANVEDTINHILTDSPALRHLADTGAITLAGAYYELSSGRVHFSNTVSLPPPAGTH